MKHRTALLFALSLVACDPPSDVIFDPPPVAPVGEGGRYRVTFNPGPDVVRGFSREGRIVYRSRGLPGQEDRPTILSIDPAGGPARVEASVYQVAVSGAEQLRFDPGGRALVLWRAPIRSVHGCPAPAPAPPSVVELVLVRLEETDGLPLSKLPTRSLVPPGVFGAGSTSQIVRVTPAEAEVRARGVDPFGPAVAQDGSGVAYLSDGETVFRVELDDPARPAERFVPGAFPSLSGDGARLAVAVPVIRDSVVTFDTVVIGLAVCVQETRTIQAESWDVVVHDLRSGSVARVGEGVEPVFDPSGTRVLVRRGGGLVWIGVESGQVTPVEATSGAFAPAVSPDGHTLAFSLLRDSADVFFVEAEQE